MKKRLAIVLVLALLVSSLPAQPLLAGSTGIQAVSPSASPSNSAIGFTVGAFTPDEALLAPDASQLFLRDGAGKRLVAAGLESGIQRSLELSDTPTKMTFCEGQLLVATATAATGADQILVVDPVALAVERTIPVAFDIIGLAADRDYIYAYRKDRIAVIDRATGIPVSNFISNDVYNIRFLAVNPASGRLYGLQTGKLTSFEVVNGQIRPIKSVEQLSYQLTIMPDGQSLLVDEGLIYSCSTDAASDLVLKKPLKVAGALCVDPLLNELYVVDQRWILAYDASSLAYKRTISEPRNLSHLLSAAGHIVAGAKDDAGNLNFTVLHTGALLASLKADGDAYTELFPLRMTADYGEVANAVDRIDIEALPAFVGAVVSGETGIQALAVGENRFTITVGDPFTGSSETYQLRISRRASDPPQPVRNGLVDLGFAPVDMAVDPDRPVAYLTAKDVKSLYRVDLLTGDVQEKRLELPAERLTIRNGKVYVTLLRTGHISKVPDGSEGYGAVAVVDTATFRIDRMINTNIDPYDIEVDDSGVIYLEPGSNMSSKFLICDSTTGQVLSPSYWVESGCLIDRNPATGKIYLAETYGTPGSISTLTIADGQATSYVRWPYHGDYAVNAYLKVSPDGKLLFNGTGNIFASTPTRDGDMVYQGKLDYPFAAIGFDMPNNRFYTSENHESVLRAYDYTTRTQRWTINLPNTVVGLQHNGHGVVALMHHYSDFNCYLQTFYPDTMLADLKVNGTTVEGFRAVKDSYSITQYTDAETVSISATALESGGKVSGDIGMQPLQLGDNMFHIRVDGAASGETAEYTLNFKRITASNADLSNIWQSGGIFSPEFSKAVTDYTLALSLDSAAANIVPSKDDPQATFTINGYAQSSMYVNLAIGESKLVEIVVTARNGVTQKTYTIHMTRQLTPLTWIGLDTTATEMVVGSSKTMPVYYDPSDNVNKAVTWSSSAPGIAAVSQDGVVSAVSPGQAVITVTASDGGLTARCKVNVVATQIESSVYTINHQDHVLSNITLGTTLDQFRAKISNSPGNIFVFDKDGNGIQGLSPLATGMTVQLIAAGQPPLETLTLSVFGDISGDAAIDINDILYIRATVLGNYSLSDWQSAAADLNADGMIDINDILYIRAHILGNYTIRAK